MRELVASGKVRMFVDNIPRNLVMHNRPSPRQRDSRFYLNRSREGLKLGRRSWKGESKFDKETRLANFPSSTYRCNSCIEQDTISCNTRDGRDKTLRIRWHTLLDLGRDNRKIAEIVSRKVRCETRQRPWQVVENTHLTKR